MINGLKITRILLNIGFVLENQDKLKMIEFGAKLMLVSLIFCIIEKALIQWSNAWY